jgi:hypothetical protein
MREVVSAWVSANEAAEPFKKLLHNLSKDRTFSTLALSLIRTALALD